MMKNDIGIGGRIKELRKDRHFTQEMVAKEAGVHLNTYSRWERGLTEPSVGEVVQLAKIFKARTDWIIHGTGTRDVPPNLDSYDSTYFYSPTTGITDADRAVGREGEKLVYENAKIVALGEARSIPVVGMVHAGEWAEACDGGYPPGRADSFVVSDVRGKNLFAVRVEGDSMEPDFKPGDIIIIDPTAEPVVGDFVIVKIESTEEVTFKKLIYRTKKLVIFRPLNINYEDIALTPKDPFRIIGRVVERKTLL